MTDKPRFQFDNNKIIKLAAKFDLTEDEVERLTIQVEYNINDALKQGALRSITEKQALHALKNTFTDFSRLPSEYRLKLNTDGFKVFYSFLFDIPCIEISSSTARDIKRWNSH